MLYMSFFIAFEIPKPMGASIREAMRSYQDVLETSVPQEKWYCTFLFSEDNELSPEALILLTQPIRQSFHPVITILSLGQGKEPPQLWAYIQDQAFLHTIHKELIQRAQESGIALSEESLHIFIPHIHIGNLQSDAKPLSVPDIPVKAKFSLPELVIVQDYETLATIPVTP